MTAFAVEVADSLPVEQGEAINLLLSLDKELASMQPLLRAWSIDLKNTDKAAPVAQVFRSLRELSDGEQLADVTEVAWAVENMLDRLIDGTLAVSQDFYAISNAAFEFLLTLSEKLSQLSPEEGVSSFIDDYIYAEIIESADILASGGDLEAKDQEFEAEFPGELGLDQATTSPSAYGNPSPALGLPLSLEETIEVFQGANSALDAALIRLATEEPATTYEERPLLIALLRQQLSISIETSNKLRALVLARNPENFL
jgi:chemotaxis protein histidine kinase CheA